MYLCRHLHTFFIMAQVKFYLEKRGDRITDVPILLAYSFHGQRLIYYTGLRVDKKYYNESYWKGTEKGNKRKPIKETAPNPDHINDQIEVITRHIYTAENEAKAAGIPLSVEYFRDYLTNKLKEKPEPAEPDKITFIQFFDQYILNAKTAINKNGERLSPANAIKYTTVKNMLVDFGKFRNREIDFADINEQLYNELVNYMITEKTYSLNTMGRTIKFIKTVLRKATRQKVNNFTDYQDIFIGATEDSDSTYLTEDELTTLYKKDFSKSPHLDRVRDIFLIGCWTGLRFSDYTNLRKEHIQGDKIRMITKKTKQSVIIPLHPVVKLILEKYNYELPRAISNQKFNDYLGKVCEDAKINEPYARHITKAGERKVISGKKYEFITSHSARRTFATNAFKRKISPLLIMSITGHRTEAEFMKYLKVTAEERAEMFAEMAKW